MLKIWLVRFSNGEEWHIFGEWFEVRVRSDAYSFVNGHSAYPEVTYLRWVKA